MYGKKYYHYTHICNSTYHKSDKKSHTPTPLALTNYTTPKKKKQTAFTNYEYTG